MDPVPGSSPRHPGPKSLHTLPLKHLPAARTRISTSPLHSFTHSPSNPPIPPSPFVAALKVFLLIALTPTQMGHPPPVGDDAHLVGVSGRYGTMCGTGPLDG
jgi:hypothetical protein